MTDKLISGASGMIGHRNAAIRTVHRLTAGWAYHKMIVPSPIHKQNDLTVCLERLPYTLIKLATD